MSRLFKKFPFFPLELWNLECHVRFSVLIEIHFGFSVLHDFLCRFSVSYRPQCPPHGGREEEGGRRREGDGGRETSAQCSYPYLLLYKSLSPHYKSFDAPSRQLEQKLGDLWSDQIVNTIVSLETNPLNLSEVATLYSSL